MQRRADPYRDTGVIDSRAPRTNQAVIGALSLLAVATGWWWLLALLALQLALGLSIGRRVCLACVFYFEVLQPRFGEGPLEDSRPPRAANVVGLVVLAADLNVADRRFPVQWVIRPMADDHHDYRGYAGQVAGGTWRAGDPVVVLPSGHRSTVAAVDTADGPIDDAIPGQSITILLADDVDVSRGDLLADPDDLPVVAREVTARVCWMSERPVEDRARVLVKHTTRTVAARIDEIVSVVDIATLEDTPSPGKMELNDLGVVRFRLAEPPAVDRYAQNRATGAFILVDEATNETVGAGMVVDAS